jgi:putative DNA primase/helicase
MSTPARKVVAAMGGKWWGNYGFIKCPIHDDGRPSLRVSDGQRTLLVRCYAGCSAGSVLEALKARRAFNPGEDQRDAADEIRKQRAERDHRAANGQRLGRAIWDGCKAIEGTASARYLRSRGITLALPPTLRHHCGLRHPHDGKKYQGLVGAVQAPDRKITGVHRTFITPAGQKTTHEEVKFSLGSISGGAIRLAAAAEEMAIAEGLETSLSYMQISGIATWASLSTSGMRSLILPPLPFARIVHIAADNDQPGQESALKACIRFQAEGRDVITDRPPAGMKDFNDMLMVQK